MVPFAAPGSRAGIASNARSRVLRGLVALTQMQLVDGLTIVNGEHLAHSGRDGRARIRHLPSSSGRE
jgi:hypothetical protein